MRKSQLNRREFMRVGVGAATLDVATKVTLLTPSVTCQASPRMVPPSDRVRFTSIGTGVRGCELLQASLLVPGTQCAATCDLYDGCHLAR